MTTKRPSKKKPPTPPRPVVSLGVGGVRRNPVPEDQVNERRGDAYTAAEASDLFAQGGPAFASWCLSEGIDPRAKRPMSAWKDLIAQFAARPVHGHRRGPNGGDHTTTKR